MKYRKSILVVTGTILVFSALFTGCHKKRGFWLKDGRIDKLITWKTNDVLEKIDATESQKQQVIGAKNEVVALIKKQHALFKKEHTEILEAFKTNTLDKSKMETILEEHMSAKKAIHKKILDELFLLNESLSPEQRAAIYEKAKSHLTGE